MWDDSDLQRERDYQNFVLQPRDRFYCDYRKLLVYLVSNAKITPHTMSFVKKLVSTFGVGFEFGSSTSQQGGSTGSESLARRAHATAQDPMFQKMKEQFTADFDFR